MLYYDRFRKDVNDLHSSSPLSSDILKVICIGTPPELLESRKLVLRSAGYDATLVNAEQAPGVLLADGFDVMILSVTLSEKERTALRQDASAGTRVIQLEEFTSPNELLAKLRS
jgi:hypothetical protein